MTSLYDSSIATRITKVAQQYILNFDINSLYSQLIIPSYPYAEPYMKFTKLHYRHFLRINNRKRYHRPNDLKTAGYLCVKVDWGFKKS